MADDQKPDSSQPNFLEMLKAALKRQGGLHTSMDSDPNKDDKEDDDKKGGTDATTSAGDTAGKLLTGDEAKRLLDDLLKLPRK